MRNYSIDSARLLVSFFVVCLHVPFGMLSDIKPIVTDFSRCAVPLFFMISGYFYSDIYIKSKSDFLLIAKRIFNIVIQAVVLYFIIDLFVFDSYEQSIYKVKNLVSYKFFIFGRADVSPILWYMHAYFVILLIWWKFGRNLKKYTAVLIMISSLTGLILGNYSGFFKLDMPSFYYCNWFVYIWSFLLGVVFKDSTAKCDEYFKNNRSLLFMLTAIFSVLPVFEHYFIKELTNTSVKGYFYVTTMIQTSLWFLIIKESKVINYPFFSTFSKKHSLNVYLYHVAVRYVLACFFYPQTLNLTYRPLIVNARLFDNAIVVFIVTLLISVVLIEVKKKTKYLINNMIK